MTQRAAELLGVGDRIGRIKTSYDADIVIFEADALGAARPSVVLIDGKVVYRSGT